MNGKHSLLPWNVTRALHRGMNLAAIHAVEGDLLATGLLDADAEIIVTAVNSYACMNANLRLLREALEAMLEVQSRRRHPLGAPDEGIAYGAADAASKARTALAALAETGGAMTDPALAGLCEMFGWQGGTIHQALAEVRVLLVRCNRMRTALEASEREFENLDEAAPVDAGCIECTLGTVPNDRNTGLCAHHLREAALAEARS